MNSPKQSGRALDRVINTAGVLAIVCMLVAVIGNHYFSKQISDAIAANIRIAGWVFIAIYLLGWAWQSRDFFKTERAQGGMNVVAQVALVLAIIGALNYLGTRHHKRWDLTENKQYSLSDQTTKVIKDLPGKVTMTMFTNPMDRSSQNSRDLLAEYMYADPSKVEFKAIDADRHPQDALKYVQSLPKDQQSKVMDNGQIRLGTVMLAYQGKVTPVTGYNEQDFTSALLKATRSGQKTLYWLEGHGESDPESFQGEGMAQLKSSLEKQNYKIDKLTLFARKEGVPADAAVVVIASPQMGYQPAELDALTSYVKRGGKVFITLRPDAQTGLEQWLSKNFGVTAQQDLVLEMDPRYTVRFNPTWPAVVKYPFHAITQSFQNYRIATVFPMTRSFTTAAKLPEGVTTESLAETSAQSEGRVSSGKFEASDITRAYDATKDVKGPLKLAIAITVTTKKAPAAAAASGSLQPVSSDYKGRIVAIGSPFFAENQLAQTSFGNGDFFLASMNWLAEEEDLISIPPKNNQTRTVDMVGGTQKNLFYGTVLAPPLALLFLGGIVWWRRR